VSITVSPTQSNVFTAVRSFLLNVLPGGNAVFSGNITGTTLIVQNIQAGSINIGDPIYGPNVAAGTIVQAPGTGTGGTGTYTLSIAQTINLQIMATGVFVVQGQVNRVSQSPSADYVVMWPLRRTRSSTNTDTTGDAKFTGSISGTTLTITQVYRGSLAVGSNLFGVGIANGTKVIAFGTGHGGVGTYSIAPTQTFASGIVSAGQGTYLQPVQIDMQLDVHGPNSAENAQIISTLWRDDYAYWNFLASGYDVTPIAADDPQQVPFINDSEQYENRWIVTASVQANEIVTAPQQYADSVNVILIDVDPTYPF
jgi:hypothetical protein